MQKAWVVFDGLVSSVPRLSRCEMLETMQRQQVAKSGVLRAVRIDSVKWDERGRYELLTIYQKCFLGRTGVSVPRKEHGRKTMSVAPEIRARAANACITEIP